MAAVSSCLRVPERLLSDIPRSEGDVSWCCWGRRLWAWPCSREARCSASSLGSYVGCVFFLWGGGTSHHACRDFSGQPSRRRAQTPVQSCLSPNTEWCSSFSQPFG